MSTAGGRFVRRKDVPVKIVFTAVTDPVGAGLVADAKAPGANVTGVSDMLPMEPTIERAKLESAVSRFALKAALAPK